MATIKTATDDGADGTAKPTLPATDHLRVSGAEFVRMLRAALDA